jgi:hypothetical protein
MARDKKTWAYGLEVYKWFEVTGSSEMKTSHGS